MSAEGDKSLGPTFVTAVHPNSPSVAFIRTPIPDLLSVGLGLLGKVIGTHDPVTLSLSSTLPASQKMPAQSGLTPAWMQAPHASCMVQVPCLFQVRMSP